MKRLLQEVKHFLLIFLKVCRLFWPANEGPEVGRIGICGSVLRVCLAGLPCGSALRVCRLMYNQFRIQRAACKSHECVTKLLRSWRSPSPSPRSKTASWLAETFRDTMSRDIRSCHMPCLFFMIEPAFLSIGYGTRFTASNFGKFCQICFANL